MSEPKIRLAVLFGGRSGEHEVSCMSAASILVSLDRDRYEVLPVRIGRDGVWASVPTMPDLPSVEEVLRWQQNGFPETGDTTPAVSILATARKLTWCDVVFPALHGRYGEDGAVQTVLEGLEIPYVGNGVAASALSMDKEFTKKIAASAGLTVADGVVLRLGQHDVSPGDRDRLGLPVFVKPAREGSSIGVSKVENWAELPAALDRARKSDDKVACWASARGRAWRARPPPGTPPGSPPARPRRHGPRPAGTRPARSPSGPWRPPHRSATRRHAGRGCPAPWALTQRHASTADGDGGETEQWSSTLTLPLRTV